MEIVYLQQKNNVYLIKLSTFTYIIRSDNSKYPFDLPSFKEKCNYPIFNQRFILAL